MSTLSRLSISNLRNIHSASIELSPKINFFYGDNGSGKTSILEAISLLGLGRSFRSHKTLSLVSHQQNELTIFSELLTNDMPMPVGIQKHRNGRSIIKVSGESVHSAMVLAKQLPLIIINAHSFQLIEGGPAQRRQFLDWLVFHVKPEFASIWKAWQKALKQRNSLLRRDKISYSELIPWDIELDRLALVIHNLRSETFRLFLELFFELKSDFSEGNLDIEMEYSQGWDSKTTFLECLKEDFNRDTRDGYTHHGPQRADIKIRVKGKAAVDVLSRGQEKALICAMHIAQAYLYREQTSKSCVFLIDDLLAELDKHHSKKLSSWLSELNGQVFVTGVSMAGMCEAWENESVEPALFHVKQGNIISNSST